MNERRGYGFSLEAKQYARDRANKTCEFGDGSCPRPNTNRVNHLTGCFEARLLGMNPKDISDPKQNAVMMCSLHEVMHDSIERRHIEKVLFMRRRKVV